MHTRLDKNDSNLLDDCQTYTDKLDEKKNNERKIRVIRIRKTEYSNTNINIIKVNKRKKLQLQQQQHR